jgi:hypothetical protein
MELVTERRKRIQRTLDDLVDECQALLDEVAVYERTGALDRHDGAYRRRSGRRD